MSIKYISQIRLPGTFLGMICLSACLLSVLAGCEQPTESAVAPTQTPPPVAQSSLVASSSRITGPSSLDELIFHSDIIARARLLSAESGSMQRYGGYLAAFEFRFQTIEYLKGSGPGELAVKVPVSNYEVYDDRESADVVADHFFTNQSAIPVRDDRWDAREAIVFLEQQSSKASGATAQVYYEFTGPEEISANIMEYQVSSPDNKAWLPAATSTGAVGGSTDVPADPEYITDATRLTSTGATGAASSSTPSMSLSDMKERIKQINDLVAEGSDIPGYRDCLRDSFRFDAYAQGGHYPPYNSTIEAPSGQGEGYQLDPNLIYESGNAYERWWTAGPDSHLFIIRITDDPDNDPSTGYAWEEVATRPIPHGKYTVFYNHQPVEWMPCNYQPEWGLNRREITIAVTAPAGVLHEAFFDPVQFGSGAGASITGDKAGVIDPAEFKHDGANVAIEQIEWSPNLNKVSLKLSNQTAKLAGHHIDFIELDAGVSLRLDFDDAETALTGYGQTLSWEVCRQPWHSGDLLMLRIAQSAGADSVTIKPVCTQGAATATATPKVTSTAEIAATPTATNTPDPEPIATMTPTPSATATHTTTPTLTPTPPSGGVSGAIDTPTPTPTSTATAEPTPTNTPETAGGVSGQTDEN